MSDESTTTNDEVEGTDDEVEGHVGGTAESTLEDLTESTLEAHDDEPDVEGHGFGGVAENHTENVADLTENKME